MPRDARRGGLLLAARGHAWAPFLQALWYSTLFGVQRCCPVRSDAAARTHGATACSPACAAMISVPRARRSCSETNPHVGSWCTRPGGVARRAPLTDLECFANTRTSRRQAETNNILHEGEPAMCRRRGLLLSFFFFLDLFRAGSEGVDGVVAHADAVAAITGGAQASHRSPALTRPCTA